MNCYLKTPEGEELDEEAICTELMAGEPGSIACARIWSMRWCNTIVQQRWADGCAPWLFPERDARGGDCGRSAWHVPECPWLERQTGYEDFQCRPGAH